MGGQSGKAQTCRDQIGPRCLRVNDLGSDRCGKRGKPAPNHPVTPKLGDSDWVRFAVVVRYKVPRVPFERPTPDPVCKVAPNPSL